MYPIPGSDQRMDEFKYLAFLSFTSRHSRKWKKIFFWMALIIILAIATLIVCKSPFWVAIGIIAAIAALIFWEFAAANPSIIQPSENVEYFPAESAKGTDIISILLKNGRILRFETNNTSRGKAVKISAYVPEKSDKQTVIKDIASTILEESSSDLSKPVLFKTPVAEAICYRKITCKREGIYHVRIVVGEIPLSNSVSDSNLNGRDYYSALLTLPKGIFAKEMIAAGNKNCLRAKSLNEKNILLAVNFEDKSTHSKDVIYIYDLAPITIKGSGIILKYGAAYSEQELSRLLLKSNAKEVNFKISK